MLLDTCSAFKVCYQNKHKYDFFSWVCCLKHPSVHGGSVLQHTAADEANPLATRCHVKRFLTALGFHEDRRKFSVTRAFLNTSKKAKH